MNKAMAGGCLFLVATAACNHTPPKEPVTQTPGSSINGLPPDAHPYYYLPAGQLGLEVTRSLDCAKTTNIASIGWEVSAKVKVVADKDHPIPLRLDALEHFGRDVEATVHFAEDGRITGITVDSKDQIGPTITSVLGSLTKIGLAVAGVALTDEDEIKLVTCEEETAKQFEAMRKMSAQIKAAEKKRAAEARKLGDFAPGSPEHEKLRKQLAALDKSIGQYKTELAKLRAPYKHSKSIEYIPEMEAKGSTKEIAAIPDKVMAGWLGGNGKELPTGGEITVTPVGAWAATGRATDGTRFYVRMPGMARVIVQTPCVVPTGGQDKKCKATENPPVGIATVFDERLPLPQAGRLLAIDLDADLFRDKVIDIELHPNGTLKTYGATEKSGMSGVSNTLSGIQQSLDSYATYRAAREAEDEPLNQVKDENALLEAQIKNLENKKKLEELQAEQAASE